MNTTDFSLRHIGTKSQDEAHMLKTIGVADLDQLIYETLPNDIKLKNKLKLDEPMSEYEYLNHIHALGNENKLFKNYIGLGYHPTITPAVIQRNIFENPGWYTAYTPYQAEIAQGRLEAILNYQTTVIELTGMEIANASLLDEGTAAAEAMALLYDVRTRDQKKNNVNKFFVSEEILPQTLSVLQTRSTPIGVELVIGNHDNFDFSHDFFGAILQYPGKYGQVYDYQAFINKCITNEIKVAVAADILSLTLLKSPGEMGADVVVGSSQRFGVPMGYGGPHAAFFCTKEEYKRSVPGRIIGVTQDMNGNRALRMALQTREQHIKREKATSNICTAQVLLAVMAGTYAVYHGPHGLKHIAYQVHFKAITLTNILNKLGIYQTNTSFFDTLVFKTDAQKVREIALENEINFYYPDNETVVVAINETTSLNDLKQIVDVFAKALNKSSIDDISLDQTTVIPESIQRTSSFLSHETFNKYHTESSLMRYIKRLERKDLALNHSMISLGSCTMKLNAAAEMLPLSMPKWNSLHPFQPLDQVQGYIKMLTKLEEQLNEITGFTGTTLQPNSGAQGEYAGLMTIRAYHHSRGDFHRDVCLIPASAHGTNPASAAMAGMKIVVTKTTPEGNIDVEDLKLKAFAYKDNLAALMVTYPSTHGVFESAIIEITKLIHDNGGLVYMDGANMNAQVGLTNPATIGADVCHLNLHKTFAIPHGGGGPGVGPICVNDKLKPFLPTNPLMPVGGEQAITAISSAPYGSALVCLISYGYICMLGAEGVTNATKYAILNANYIKARLEDHYPILYAGEMGRCAHEMILDCRAFKQQHGIEVVDIAKRLMDYGFHAPTVSFPVAGTLMVEPTESEDLAELDRFCDAMISIREEIDKADVNEPNNVLKNAPHTLEMVTVDIWGLPYSRGKAAFPLNYVQENKFWPAVRRVDEAYGDRNLICTCAPIEAYQ